MAKFNNAIFHGLINVTDNITLTDNKYNVAKYNTSDGMILSEATQRTLLQGTDITIGRTSNQNTEYILLNGNRIRLRGIDKYTYGTSDPISSGQVGQLYFKLITIA